MGKVKKDRLVKRDPKLKGKDRPSLSPDEVFGKPTDDPDTTDENVGAEAETTAEAPPVPVVIEPVKKSASKKTEAERRAAVERLLDLIDDGSTTDDW